MKLASLRRGDRDGRLAIVSRDLSRCQLVPGIAPTLQAALDDWSTVQPRLAERAAALELSPASSEVMPFDPAQCAAPLPRAYHWVDGSAYVNHVELVRKARGAEMPASFWTDPLVYQGGSADFLGPTEDVPVASEEFGMDLEGEVAVLTPDELGEAWDGGKINLPLTVAINGAPFGKPEAGVDMTFDFPHLIAHITKTRNARAGTVLGSGTISNYDRSRGSACLAERRTLEVIEQGKPVTPFLKFGDRVRIEMLDKEGRSIFGAIDQVVVRA